MYLRVISKTLSRVNWLTRLPKKFVSHQVCVAPVTALALSWPAREQPRHLPPALGRLGVTLMALMYSAPRRAGVMVSAICEFPSHAEVVAHLACQSVFVA